MRPSLTVIVLNYNSKRFLPDLFNSLAKQTWDDFELFLVDNASRDGGVALAKKLKKNYALEDKTVIIENKKNLGFCKGNNIAAWKAKGKYLLFLNVDTKFDDKCFEKLIQSAEGNPAVGIWQSYILNYDYSLRTAGNNYDIYAAKAQPKEWRTFFASGACLLIRNELFKKIGGFDEALFLMNDDADLAWRVRLLGYGVGCATESICYHYGNYATGGQTPQNVYFLQRNRIRISIKNYSAGNITKRLGIILSLILLFGIYYAMNNKNVRYLTSVLKAFFWNIKYLRDTLYARKIVQRQRIVQDSEIEKHMIPYSTELYSFSIKIGLSQSNVCI